MIRSEAAERCHGRAALEPDPGSFIVSSDVRMMRSP